MLNPVDGKDNMGGVQTVVMYGLMKDVLTFPQLPDIGTATLATGALLDGSELVMKVGKKLFDLYGTQDTIEVTFEEQGPIDGKSGMAKITLSHPGMQKEIAAFVRGSNNSDMFFIASDTNGYYHLVGNAAFPAKRAGGKATTGKATGDGKVTELTFQAPAVCPLLIDLLQADIDRLMSPALA